MSTNPANPSVAPPSPKLEPTQEVRFAVVMYGGVSLAIYINGVAQELLRMVRSTAPVARDASGNRALLSGVKPDAADDPDRARKLQGTERVYRKLSYLLADERLLEQCRQRLAEGSRQSLNELLDSLLDENREPVNTRFIVDILSGTSAGGINSIHLAKALTNDQQIDQLKELWINEGDIALLINDKKSVAGLQLAKQDPPQSLLNSRRMYLKLLKSLDDMGGAFGAAEVDSPYVDELDLFITATDIEGVPLPIRLSDTIVYERRHRNVFHFRYEKPEATGKYSNDFARENNPFLAFAARCTSSFPFAFEPMRLGDIDEVLEAFPQYDQSSSSSSLRWQPFFEENLKLAKTGGGGGDADQQPTGENGKLDRQFTDRSFGDGGYLDNKPFSYATETLAHRHSAVPVDRKLIYIEPSPEHPETELKRLGRPDALSNVKAALLDLPSYETIREDLQRVLERNRLISRVNRIINAIEEDVNRAHDILKREPYPSLDRGDWIKMDMAHMLAKYGPYYIPYRRLRISSVTDDLALLIARAADFDENSDQFTAIRSLVRAWREENYLDYRKNGEGAQADTGTEQPEAAESVAASRKSETVNAFLQYFDFHYRVRRMNFVRAKLDTFYKLCKLLPGTPDDQLTDEQRHLIKRLSRTTEKRTGLDFHTLDEKQRYELRHVISAIKCEMNEAYKDLRANDPGFMDKSRGRSKQNPLKEGVQGLNITSDDLRYILGAPKVTAPLPDSPQAKKSDTPDEEPFYGKTNEYESFKRAQEILKEKAGNLKSLADSLKLLLNQEVIGPVDERCSRLVDTKIPFAKTLTPACLPPKLESLTEAQITSFRRLLGEYYNKFEEYDQVSFPILYQTDVGEADVVEIIRISPEDAPSLIDEKRSGRRKLAGTALHHFGAFLDRSWRQNDIMWGRFDGAERLITSLLPDEQNKGVREALIEEAHLSILSEEMPVTSRQEIGGLMANALVRASAGDPASKAVKGEVQRLIGKSPVQNRLQAAIRYAMKNEELLTFMQESYEVNRQLDPHAMLQAMSRSTQIIGKVFEDIARQNNQNSKSFAWIARLGQWFWGLIEVAVPNSILNMLFIHWLGLLYAFEIFLIIGGVILSRPGAQQFGWTAFGITATLNIIMLVLRDRMRGKHWVFGLLVGAAIFVITLLTVVGALEVWGSLGARWGEPPHELPPLEWLKQGVRAWTSTGWVAEHRRFVIGLAAALLLLAVFNVVGLIDLVKRRISLAVGRLTWRWKRRATGA
jgi:patatin-related protein